MIVDSKNIELGYELAAVIPWAYAKHLKGELDETIGGVGSEAFYYFSPKHTINPAPRDWHNTKDCKAPNIYIHKPLLDKDEWVMPPYKEHFSATAIRFKKPTVVIYNRYNEEWGRPPINFFDLPTLRTLFSMLLPKYEVVYFNIRGQEALEDNAHSMDLGDFPMIKKEFPKVKVIHDLVKEYGGDYSDVQLRVFAGCERFVTMNGGPAMMASCFGGENIIYSKECRELWPTVNSFYNWYPDFGGSTIRVVNTHSDLIDIVRSKWASNDPLINILVRSHDREQSFDRMFKSIQAQDYKNWRVIASYDNERTWKYLQKYPCDKVKVSPIEKPATQPNNDDYRSFLPSNLYLNTLAERVTSGYITYIDDDDYYADGAMSCIARNVDPYKLTIWKAVAPSGRHIPSPENWKKVVAGDISGIAFAFHYKQLGIAQWEPWRRGDYRVIKSLYSHLKTTWLNYPMSVIGKTLPNKATPEYIAAKQLEHKALVDQINASVAAKKLVVPIPVVSEPVVQEAAVCPHCGR